MSSAIRELLAVTQWGALDCLLVDMPPGISDEVLDLARLIPRLEALVISTPSSISVAVVRRLLSVLADMHVPVAGIIANMAAGRAVSVREMAARTGNAFAGEVQADASVEAAIGDLEGLASTRAASDLRGALAVVGLLQASEPS